MFLAVKKNIKSKKVMFTNVQKRELHLFISLVLTTLFYYGTDDMFTIMILFLSCFLGLIWIWRRDEEKGRTLLVSWTNESLVGAMVTSLTEGMHSSAGLE